MVPIATLLASAGRRTHDRLPSRALGPWFVAFFYVLIAASAGGEDDAKRGSDAARFERLVHERDIERLIHDYAWHLDAQDFAAYGTLFRHGAWLAPDGSVVARGSEAVETMVRRFLGGRTDPFVRHLVTNLRIDLSGDTRTATATSFLTTLEGTLGGDAVLYRIARYHDHFRRIDGRWWFESRKEMTDWVLKERPTPGAP